MPQRRQGCLGGLGSGSGAGVGSQVGVTKLADLSGSRLAALTVISLRIEEEIFIFAPV